MSASNCDPVDIGPAASASIFGLARASRGMAREEDPVQALWLLVGALRSDLSVDRVAVFSFDPHLRNLVRVVSIDRAGQPQYGGLTMPLTPGTTPLRQVARGDIPYYHTDSVLRDYPALDTYAPLEGVEGLVIVPIVAAGELLGALTVDNALSTNQVDRGILDPLFLYAGLAALPLFALYQQAERERAEALRREVYREVFLAVSNGRIRLCDQREIEEEWPGTGGPIPIQQEQDVRVVRQAVRRACEDAGMDLDRAADLGLCASEAATNALLHGNGGTATVGRLGNRVRVRVTDNGPGIALEQLPRAALQKGWSERKSMGLGFTVIHETADCLYLHTGRSGTTLIIEMAIHPEDRWLDTFPDLEGDWL